MESTVQADNGWIGVAKAPESPVDARKARSLCKGPGFLLSCLSVDAYSRLMQLSDIP